MLYSAFWLRSCIFTPCTLLSRCCRDRTLLWNSLCLMLGTSACAIPGFFNELKMPSMKISELCSAWRKVHLEQRYRFQALKAMYKLHTKSSKATSHYNVDTFGSVTILNHFSLESMDKHILVYIRYGHYGLH